MQQSIVIPSPSGADTETVTTALETAAVFRAKGDRREAMRWLRRAAESAGEAGDDERALSLSRIAADLQDELSSEQPQAAAPEPHHEAVPPPPPPPSSARAAEAPDSRPQLSYPPPPSARPRPSSIPRASQAPRPSSRPSSRPSYVGGARTALSVVPPLPASMPASSVATPVPGLAEPSPAQAAPAPGETTATPISAPAALSGTGARRAARVAVTISTSKVGVLEVRLLSEGDAPRIGSSEALLVMLDPTSMLLAR